MCVLPTMLRRKQPGLSTYSDRTNPMNVLQEYAEEATVHGVRYLASGAVTTPGKVCWLAAMLTCGVFAGLFVHTAWLAYRNSPTRTSVESTHFPLHRVPFPAVTICPATKVRRTAGERLLARYLNFSLEDEGVRRNFWHVLSALSMHQFPFHFRMVPHLTAAEDLIPLLTDLNITDFMLQVLPPCKEFFEICYWQGRAVDCCEIFHLQRYEAGFCYSFNSMTIDRNLNCPPLLDMESTIYETNVPQQQICSLLRNGVSGTTTGLEVFLPFSKHEDQLGMGQRDANGARILVHHPLQFPEAGKGLLMPEINDTVLTIRVAAAVTQSSLAIRTLSYKDRQCYFPDEWQLKMSRTYSQKNCLLECRLHHITKECQCVPYFFNLALDQPVCNLSRLACIAEIDRDLRFLRLQETQTHDEEQFLNCSHCLPTCHDISYILDAAISKDTNPIVRGAYLDIFYADLSAVKYRRELAFDYMQLIVSFGGIAGLFLGVSLLSGVELLYYGAVFLKAVFQQWKPHMPVGARKQKVWHVAPVFHQT